MQIIRGKQRGAKKVVIHGPAGIGKSTLAGNFPDPVFIDVEGSTKELDVARFQTPTTWEELLEIVRYVISNPDCCKTLVIDTADWAERLMMEYLCRVNKWKSIETPGYGKGYQYCAEEFARLLDLLNKVIELGIHVVFTAHSKMRKFEQPDEMGAYDRWEMKLSRQVSPLLVEWCDLLLFCNYRTFVVQSDNAMEKAKVQGGKRVMYTTHHPCWDAKNRQGLPEILDLDYQNIAFIFEDSAEPSAPAEKPIDTLRSMMAEANVTETEIQQVVASKGHYAADVPINDYTDKFLNGWLIKYWPQVLKLVDNARKSQI